MITPKNNMYLTKEDLPEFQNYFAKIYGDYSGGKSCRTITFVVTERCNLNCTYCYEKHEFHRSGKIMSKEVAKQAIDMILDNEKMNNYMNTDNVKGIILDFIGGEPLLEIDLIDYICDYFKKKTFEIGHPWAMNYMISISTNGLIYNSPKVQKFIEKNKYKCSIGITIDGNKDLHDACRVLPNGKGSYDIVEKSVKNAINDGILQSTKLTLAPQNVKFAFDAITNLWDMGLQFIYANCVYEEGWNIEHAKILYKEMKKLADYLLVNKKYDKYMTSLFNDRLGEVADLNQNYCGGNGDMLAIGPDGLCYPCLRYMSHSMQSNREPFICGNIQDGLIDPTKDEKLCKLCSVTMKTQSPEKCLNCPISSECGACNGYNYDKFGDPNIKATYICEMHKARVLANIYYWNNLYKQLNLNKKIPMNVPKEWAINIVGIDEYNYLLNL